MLLAVDIGNTNLAVGLFDGAELRQTFRAETVRSRTADEYAVLLRQMIHLRDLEPSVVSAGVVASVVPPLTDVLVDAIRQAFAREPLVIGPGVRTGISVLYDHPRDVGADRIVNAVAAHTRFGADGTKGVIVVDFGTATTFDCISPKAEYLGGVIVPGINVSLNALLERADKLTRIEITAPPKVVGRSTPHSLQSGVVHGYAALVDGLIAKLKAELGFPCEVLATGGLAKLIAKYSESLKTVDEHITLEGLRLIFERNVAASEPRVSPPAGR